MTTKTNAKRREGRPTTVMTEEMADKIVRLVRLGMWPDRAAAAEGIADSTMRAHRSRHPEFATRIEQAEALAESSVNGRLLRHMEKHPSACQWYLERRWPKRWGRRDESVEQLAEAISATVGPKAPPQEQLADYLAKLASIASHVGLGPKPAVPGAGS